MSSKQKLSLTTFESQAMTFPFYKPQSLLNEPTMTKIKNHPQFKTQCNNANAPQKMKLRLNTPLPDFVTVHTLPIVRAEILMILKSRCKRQKRNTKIIQRTPQIFQLLPVVERIRHSPRKLIPTLPGNPSHESIILGINVERADDLFWSPRGTWCTGWCLRERNKNLKPFQETSIKHFIQR